MTPLKSDKYARLQAWLEQMLGTGAVAKVSIFNAMNAIRSKLLAPCDVKHLCDQACSQGELRPPYWFLAALLNRLDTDARLVVAEIGMAGFSASAQPGQSTLYPFTDTQLAEFIRCKLQPSAN